MKRLEIINFAKEKSKEEAYLDNITGSEAATRAAVRTAIPFGNTVGVIGGGVGGRKYHGMNMVAGYIGSKVAGDLVGGATLSDIAKAASIASKAPSEESAKEVLKTLSSYGKRARIAYPVALASAAGMAALQHKWNKDKKKKK